MGLSSYVNDGDDSLCLRRHKKYRIFGFLRHKKTSIESNQSDDGMTGGKILWENRPNRIKVQSNADVI